MNITWWTMITTVAFCFHSELHARRGFPACTRAVFTCHLSLPIFHQITARRHIYTTNEMQSFRFSTLCTSVWRYSSTKHPHWVKKLFDKFFGPRTHFAWCRKVWSICLINKISQSVCLKRDGTSFCIENLCLILTLFRDSSNQHFICWQICTMYTFTFRFSVSFCLN